MSEELAGIAKCS